MKDEILNEGSPESSETSTEFAGADRILKFADTLAPTEQAAEDVQELETHEGRVSNC